MSAHSTNAAIFGTSRQEGLFSRVTSIFAVRKQRHDLAQLDDHALRDIGISRYEAQVEANRPMWDVPHHWIG